MKMHQFLAPARGWWRAALVACLAWLAPAVAAIAAPVSMTDIGFNALPGGKFEIRMQFDGAPPSPQGYTIDKPARIALDLPGVGSKLAQKKHTLAFDNAQSVVVVESGGRTRVIVNLVEVAPYEATVQGNELVVAVGSGRGTDFLMADTGSSASSLPAATGHGGITDFNFRRGEAGEGRVELKLSNPNVDVDVRLEGSTIKVAFFDTTVPDNLQRRYDVVDFATPVQSVEVSQSGAQAAIGIKVGGEYDYLAYQADGNYVVAVKPLTRQEVEQKKKEFEFVGEKLSLNFQDIEVRAVLQLIADFTDLNLVASDTVSGRITLRLQNVPWDQALDLILKTKGLDKRQVGNVLMVAPAAEIAEQERQRIEASKQLEELAPLQTEFIKIKYASATEIFKMFGQGQGANVATGASQGDLTGQQQRASILSPRGQVVVDERTNSLMVTETAEKLDELRRLIKSIDVPVRQVLIEARIVIASTDFSRQLGIQWGGAAIYDENDNSLWRLGGSMNTLDELDDEPDPETGRTEITFPDALGVDLGVTGQGTSSIAIGFAANDILINAELSALEASGHGEIVSQPKVITGDKQQATIEQGTEIPYQRASSSGETTVEFKDAVLKLDVTPHITPDDRVVMKLVINQDSVGEFINGEFGSQIPTIDTTALQTEVLVGNGETIVLGGVFQNEEIISESKTPFLGDIPYVGRLFRKDVKEINKQETLIFITPKIIGERLLD